LPPILASTAHGAFFETETPMDLPRLLAPLLSALAGVPEETPVGVFLARHPDFALLARRIQALAGSIGGAAPSGCCRA
jgi:hypothetical protein